MMMPQPGQERRASSSESVSSFSSSASSEDDQNFKEKYISEKEKCRKLNEALVEIIVSQLREKKGQSEYDLKHSILTLEKKLEDLKTQLTPDLRTAAQSDLETKTSSTDKSSEEVFTELDYVRESISDSKKTSNSSASFVVLDGRRESGKSSSFVLVDKQEVEGSQPNSVEPLSEYFLTAVGLEEVLKARNEASEETNDAQPFQSKDCPAQVEVSEQTNKQTSEQNNSSASASLQQGSQSPQSGASAGTHSLPKDHGRPMTTSQQQSLSNGQPTISFQHHSLPKVHDSQPTLSQQHQTVQQPLPLVHSHKSTCGDSPNPTQRHIHQAHMSKAGSHSSNAGSSQCGGPGLVAISAWRGESTVKPAWQLDQELTSRASRITQSPREGLGGSPSPQPQSPELQSSVVAVSDTQAPGTLSLTALLKTPSDIPNTQPGIGTPALSTSTGIPHLTLTTTASVPGARTQALSCSTGIPHLNPTTTASVPGARTTALSTAGTNTTTTTTSTTWGVGARPKSTNTVREVTPGLTPLVPLTPVRTPPIPWAPGTIPSTAEVGQHSEPAESWCQLGTSDESRQVGTSDERRQVGTSEESQVMELFAGANSLAAPPSSCAVTTSHNTLASWAMPSVGHLGSFTSGDLMTFPSLKTSPSPEEKQKNLSSTGEHLDPSRIGAPSDVDSELVSQAHSMMAALESQSQSGISEMLYKFARTASQMEQKLTDYQALIQRQQVQIQSLSEHSHAKELEQLRKENGDLLAYINQSRDRAHSRDELAQSGGTQDKFLSSGQASPSECAEKRIEVLEGLNAKLFQANKEWAVRWEVFRQQRKDEKKDFEARLQVYVAEIEKLRRDFATMEKQLTDAVMARQEANRQNLVLEQGKLDMLKKIESLKAETEKLLQTTRRLETELATLKADRLKGRGPAAGGQSHQELEAEISLLKQQLSVFHEDFQKEREDRQKAEGKAERNRKQQETMKAEYMAKTKKWQAMVKSKDEEIKQKMRKLAELQYQVDHLKIQLQREKKLLALQSQHTANNGPPPQISMNYPLTPTNAPIEPPTLQPPTFQPPTSSGRSPEHQPGAWECRRCTFINFPEKRTCEICDTHYEPGGAKGAELPSGRTELHSRGNIYSLETDTHMVPTYTDLEVDGPTQ